MRLGIVTSQFPIAGDVTRGRPLLQTIEALARAARLRGDVDIKVFVPNARYPRPLRPRSYHYVPTRSGVQSRTDFEVEEVSYPTLPVIGRLTNGHAVARSIEQPLGRFAPDVVLAYWLYPDAFGAVEIASRLGVPCISGARGSDLRVRDSLSLALTRSAVKRSQHVLTVSEDLKQIAVQRFGARALHTTTIPNGCNIDVFHCVDRLAARRELGLPADERIVLYVGRLAAAKGLRELLQAWEALARDDSHLRVAFVGNGALYAELGRTAAAMGMADRVSLPGRAGPEVVARWMQACDVFCLPSHSEGYPNVLVEALACGRPVVASAVGGIVEIVDEHNGLLVPIGDVARLSKALRDALDRTWDEGALSGRLARSWDQVAAETLDVCNSVMGKGY